MAECGLAGDIHYDPGSIHHSRFDGIACLTQAEGQVLWTFAFAGLNHFQLRDGRLFCLAERRRLLALDAVTGHVLWSREAPGANIRPLPPAGRFYEHFLAAQDWVALQTGGGKLLILDSRTGRQRAEREFGPASFQSPR